MDAGTHRYFDTSSNEFDGVMAMKDESIVLTAAVIRLSPPGKNATNCPAWKPHAFTNKGFYLPQILPQGKAFHQYHLLSLLSKAFLPHAFATTFFISINWTNKFTEYPVVSGHIRYHCGEIIVSVQ